jgi:phosphatidylglycerophosphatase A
VKWVYRGLSTFFGLGFVPVGPGTLSSAAAVLIYRLALYGLPWPWYMVIFLVLVALGTAASGAYAAELGQADPQRIVIDETAGQLLALFQVPIRWLPLTLAFVFFRFFDIIKPGPIRSLERLPGGWGIMADDLGAGLAAGALVHVLLLWI